MRNHRLEVTNTSSITSEMRRMGDLQSSERLLMFLCKILQ